MNGRTKRPLSTRRLLFSSLTAAVIICCGALLAGEPELRLAIPLLVGGTAVMALVLASVLYAGERDLAGWSPVTILTVALILRLLFLFAPPQLSDDLYRYHWDGSTLLRGVNPYAAAPGAVAPPPALRDIHRQINHPEYVTIYPPGAQVVFAAGVALGRSLTGLKALLVLIDLGLCLLLMKLLKRLELPVWRAVLYAWNPLPVIEIAGSGHVDGAGMALFMGALLLVLGGVKNRPEGTSRRRPFLLSGGVLAGACLVKLFPLVLAPVLWLLVPRRQRFPFLAGAVAAGGALLLPFVPHLAHLADTLGIYGRTWEFSGFAFSILRRLTGSGSTARVILAGMFVAIGAVVLRRLARRLTAEHDTAARGRLAMSACYTVTLSLLLLSPTLHPWYALCLAPFLPFSAGPAGIILCWSVFLSYQIQILYFITGAWREDPFVTAAIFLAPVAAGAAAWVGGKFGRRPPVRQPGRR